MKKAIFYLTIAIIVLSIATGAGLIGVALLFAIAPIGIWKMGGIGGPRFRAFFGPWPRATDWRQLLSWAAPAELCFMGFTLVTGALFMKFKWLSLPTDQIETPLLAFLVIISPPIEEILFRGLLFRFCERRVGTWTAMIASSVVFGALHMDPGALGKILSGILFCTLVKKSGGLWVPMGLHLLSNCLVFSLTFVPESAGLSEERQMLIFGSAFMLLGLPWALRAARETAKEARLASQTLSIHDRNA